MCVLDLSKSVPWPCLTIKFRNFPKQVAAEIDGAIIAESLKGGRSIKYKEAIKDIIFKSKASDNGNSTPQVWRKITSISTNKTSRLPLALATHVVCV